MFPVYYIFNFLMTLLLVLHVFWYYLITLIAYRVCFPFHFILQAFKIVSRINSKPSARHSIQVICVGALTDDSRSDSEESAIENNSSEEEEGENDSRKKNS